MSGYVWAGLYTLLEILKYLLCLIFVFNIPICKKKITIPVWIVVSLMICMLYYCIYNYEGIFFLLPDACVLLLLFSFEKKKKLKGILYIIFTWIIMDSFSEIVRQIYVLISGNEEYLSVSTSLDLFVEKYIVLAFLLLYHFIVNVCIRKKVLYFFYPYQWVIIFIFFVATLMIVITLEGVSRGLEVDTNDYITMCVCAMLMLFVFIILMIWQSYVLRKNMTMKERELSYQYMLRSQSDHFDSLRKNDEEMRKLRHDMTAHMTALKELAASSDDNRIVEYLNIMGEKVNHTNTKRYTGNSAADAVINELVHRMENNDISFSFEGIINIREDIMDFDLCTIFYNILQNAIEGSMVVEDADKSIFVKVKNIGDKIGITIENKTILRNIPDSGLLVTTKEDKMNHGFGTLNVKEVVSKYEGIYENKIDENNFIVDIII